MTKTHEWYCKSCNQRGVVRYEDGSDQWNIIAEMAEAHIKKSSRCIRDYLGLSILADNNSGDSDNHRT